MSKTELHILKNRLQQGMWNKAERGEVLNHAPIGYVRSASARNGAGDYVIDVDGNQDRCRFDEFVGTG